MPNFADDAKAILISHLAACQGSPHYFLPLHLPFGVNPPPKVALSRHPVLQLGEGGGGNNIQHTPQIKGYVRSTLVMYANKCLVGCTKKREFLILFLAQKT